MGDKSVVITGANSYLGSSLVRYLIERTQCASTLLYRIGASLPGSSHPGLTVLQADLTQAVPKTILQALPRPNGIVHFAWTRIKAESGMQVESPDDRVPLRLYVR